MVQFLSRYKGVLFSLLFVVASLYIASELRLISKIGTPPQGLHAWRQTDGASIAYLYYQENAPLLKPTLHTQTADFYGSGDCATSEFPVFYYFIGKCHQWFGFSEAYARIITLSLMMLALLAAFLSIYSISKSFFISALPVLYWFSSPVIIFYSSNFLSNEPALCFALVGAALLLKYGFDQKTKWLAIATLSFAIAGLLKITALLSLIAFILALVAVGIFSKQKFNFKAIAILSLGIVPTAIWIWYAKAYNAEHQCYYFSTQLYPIWELDADGIWYFLNLTIERWSQQFYPVISLVVIGLSLIALVLRNKHIPRLLMVWWLFVSTGVIAYLGMQFQVLFAHDYYFLNLFILPFLILVLAALSFRNKANIKLEIIIGVALSVLLYMAFQKTDKLDKFRTRQFDDPKKMALLQLEPWLGRIGVKANDKVVFATDESNVPLYYLKRKGWTQYGNAINAEGGVTDSDAYAERLNRMGRFGAKYVLLYEENESLNRFPELVPHLGEFVGDSLGLSVYRYQ